MHVRKRAMRLLSAVALVTFALPLAASGVTPAVNAQTTTGTPPASITDVGSVAPAVAFNPIGTPHTVTFTCGALGFAVGVTAAEGPGCYDVTATAQDITTGSAIPIQTGLCGGVAAPGGGGNLDCTTIRSPICPTGTIAGTATGVTLADATCATSATSTAATPDITNQVTATINPGAPHAYTIDFSGYVPTSAAGSCPAGTTGPVTVTLNTTETTATTGIAGPLAPTTACRFTVEAQKKYAEVTSIVITPVSGCTNGSLTFAEGLKSFFGPACLVNIVATGTVILKTGVNCTNGTEPATGTAAPAEFGASAVYSCDANGVLSVTGVTGPGNTSLPGVSLVPGSTGVGSFVSVGNLGSLCAGSTSATATMAPIVTTTSGASATLCPTGPGAASLQVCLGPASSLPNNQPPLCSNTINFNYTLNTQRVVPYVRWAGEKVELTKCFGVGLAGFPVEFVLKGNNPGLNATLLPTSFGSTVASPGITDQNTIFTTTDARGCATVLGLADGEGVMYVDAAVFNTSAAGLAAGAPLVNEHAFEVFYLKFDHLDLENIKFQTYSTATALQPYLGYLSASPVINSAALGSSFQLPNAPGTGQVAGAGTYAVPLCQPDFVRAMVHGYFEMSGDPSGRPAAQVAIPGAATGSAGSYVLPAGRWVLPEDWPLLATFAGFSNGTPTDITPSSVFAWDLNSGWAFNPTGEKPVLCGLAAGVIGNGLLLGGSPSAHGATTGTIPVGYLSNGGSEDVGPCFGQDAVQTGSAFYATAPGSLTPADQAAYAKATGFTNCLTGFTAGFGPFDITRACTNPFPLSYTPAGASVIGTTTPVAGGPARATDCPAGIAAPCLLPTNPDSTYLPNGTLNQWDAPMPPAQISFGITGGPGYLGEVSKTGLYQIRFDAGAPTGTPATTCPQGYTLYSGTNTCQLELDPNPFYAAAIPPSPYIPPVDNNHSYLFNSWNFTGGTTTLVSSTPAFTGVPAGGFVAGQSTTVSAPVASFGGTTCPTLTTGNAATATTCAVAGGVNLTAPTTTGTTTSIVVGDVRGFMAGMTVEIYTLVNGQTVVTSAPITAVLPSPRTISGTNYPNAGELQFASANVTAAAGLAPFSFVVVGNDFGLPVPGAGAFTVGQQVSIGSATSSVSPTVTFVDTTNNIVYVGGAELLAQQLGTCVLSRTATGSGTSLAATGFPIVTSTGATATLVTNGCEPNALVAAGTVLETGPVGAQNMHPTLYPFWQWLPTPPTATDTPSQATVYSDNHGEAVVSLNTSLQAQVAPVNNACTAPYVPVTQGTTVTTCLLPLAALGTTNIGNGTFGNVKSALGAFSASNPGCIQTYPSGTTATLTGTTVGAAGPGNGQICVNALGGIEFGAGAALGTTTVQAVADYPYIREHAQIASAPLTKVFTSAFAKTLAVSAGTAAPAGTTAYTVTITETDVCGNPIVGEPVNVYALSGSNGVVLAPVNVGQVLSSSTNSATVTVVPTGASAGTATLSLEVLNTAIGNQGLVVKAVFPYEQLERFVTVQSGVTQGSTTTVVYAPGWQQVGGPANTDFSTVEALFSYDPASGQYLNATNTAGHVSSAAPGCTGYWGYFAAAMTVNIPVTSKSGDTAACTLAAGYNLVGDPFGTTAKLPSGVTAYSWNGTSYITTNTIGVGGSVWVYNDGTLNTLTLTAS